MTAVVVVAVSVGALTGAAVAAASPSISVVPATDLFDGQLVTVTGSGFSADVTAVQIHQCWVRAPHCEDRAVAQVSGGAFSTVIAVSRFSFTRDCLQDQEAGEPCNIDAWNLDGGAGPLSEFAFTQLTFADVDTVAGAPTIIRNATAGNESATVSWTAPASDGGSSVSGYVVTPYVGYSPRPATTFNSTATTQTVTGLTNGTQYRFRVQAVNGVGTGPFSTVTNPVVPMQQPPGAPTIIRNATAGDSQATVSWTAPTSDGGSAIIGYIVTPYIGYAPQPATPFHSTATTQTVTGLVNGTQYRFRVRAVNSVGAGPFSTVTNPVVPMP